MAVAHHERVRPVTQQFRQDLGVEVHRTRLVDHDNAAASALALRERSSMVVS
jgi:hypothetical protein